MARTVVSPDGRTWRVKKIRERGSFAEDRREPSFWPRMIVTVVLVGLIVRMLWVDPVSPVMLMFVVPLALLWLVERGAFLLTPRIEAATEGPPPERVVWKAGHLFGSGRFMRRAVETIEAGQAVSEPRGLRLVQWDSGDTSRDGASER